ncbi:DUF58 domain-containing protein [Halosolutus gelatinilyticus]|uniref:DUF58 domain-containing protein n=1 Tax=Halosolutus gelatinilyticus TaxID=2931975 RepID=UPI001FF2C9C2|nr:DUF58 domain-containing protein [Halosolutus gelatinilyticus]
MRTRGLLVGAGLGLFGLALVEMVAPGSLPMPIGDPLVPVVGGLVLCYAYYVRWSGDGSGVTQASIPDPEDVPPTPTPGDEFDEVLKQFLDSGTVYSTTRTKRGLRAAAIAVLTRYADCTESEARERVDDGTWTADPYAASLLSETNDSPGRLLDRLRTPFLAESQYERAVRRTVSEIAAIAAVPVPEREVETIRSRIRQTIGSSPERTAAPSPARRAASGPAATDGRAPAGTTVDSDRMAAEGSTTRSGIRRSTNHWSGVGLVAFVALGVGLLVERPAILLAAVVGIGYAAYARSMPLEPVQLSFERSLGDDDPEPGDDVEVTVTITNGSSRFLPDLRVVDGVPPGLAVTDGSPRFGTALRAGDSTTFSYTVTARRGEHEFRPAIAVARNLPGTVERELLLSAPSVLRCVPPLRPTREAVPLRAQASEYTGVVETDAGGAGVEFYSTRQYQPGDAMNRIDWHHHARTGELATLKFRRERAAVVVLVVDVQSSAYVSPGPESEHAVDRSIAAARRIFAGLLADGHRVGIAAMGAPDCWLAPSTGRDHRARGRTLFATDPIFSSVPDDDQFTLYWKRRLRRRLPDAAQLIVFSPLCDRSTIRYVREFEARGHSTTVVSPDPTADRTPGQQLARVYRTVATTDLRRAEIPVLDWAPEESLDEVLARARAVTGR